MMSESPYTLAWYRKKVGLTQKDVARAIGVSVNTVSAWETGLYWPSGRHLIALLDLFDNCRISLCEVTVDE